MVEKLLCSGDARDYVVRVLPPAGYYKANWCWVWGQAKSNSRNNEVIVHEVMSDFTAFADVKIDQAAPLPNPMEYL